jgi:hypothetical protein
MRSPSSQYILLSCIEGVARTFAVAFSLIPCCRSLGYDGHVHDFLDLEATMDSVDSSSISLTS